MPGPPIAATCSLGGPSQEGEPLRDALQVETTPRSPRANASPPLSADPATARHHSSPSQDGFLHAIRRPTGWCWRFPPARSVRGIRRADRKEGLYHDRVGGMFCPVPRPDSNSGGGPDILRFVAASKQRSMPRTARNLVRSMPRLGGGSTGSTPDSRSQWQTSQTDRIYLASESGLSTVLREIELEKRVQHRRNRWPRNRKRRRRRTNVPSRRPPRAASRPPNRSGRCA